MNDIPMTILGFPNRPVQDRVMIMLCYVLMRLAYLELAVLGSLDHHDTYDVSKTYDKLRRTYDGSRMHDRLGKHDHTRIINRQVVL